MVLQLHIYGPAFGLPSIDADCLAAILYLQQCLPQESWTLIASNDPKRNPFHRLPALLDDNQWVAGYERITKYLEDKSYGDWALDRDLTEIQQATKNSLIAFIRSRGQPLLDVSLYVSSSNYTTCTRPAWSNLLSWPSSWTIPHKLREHATMRSEHLGLGALNIDAAEEKDKKDEGLSAHIPKSLRKPKLTVSNMLGQNAKTTRFRLDAVTADFLEPLQARLRENGEWLVADRGGSADYLAVAYLLLMQTPQLPHNWLSEALTSKYANLGSWALNRGVVVKPASSESEAQTLTSSLVLPWSQPEPKKLLDGFTDALESLVSSIPVLRAGYEAREVKVPVKSSKSEYKDRQLAYAATRKRQALYSQVVTGCLGTASALAWLYHMGILILPQRGGMSHRRNFGEAGMLLGLR